MRITLIIKSNASTTHDRSRSIDSSVAFDTFLINWLSSSCRLRAWRVSRFAIFSTCSWSFLQQCKHRDVSLRSTLFIMNSYYLIFLSLSSSNHECKIISLSTTLKLTFELIDSFCLFFLSHDLFSFALFSFFYVLIFSLVRFDFVKRNSFWCIDVMIWKNDEAMLHNTKHVSKYY